MLLLNKLMKLWFEDLSVCICVVVGVRYLDLSIGFNVFHKTKCVPSPHILAWTLPAMRHRRRRCRIPQMPSNFHHHHPYGQQATCSRIQSIATWWETLIFLVLVKVQLQCGLQFSQGILVPNLPWSLLRNLHSIGITTWILWGTL